MKFPERPDFQVTVQPTIKPCKTEARQESHRSTCLVYRNVAELVSFEITICSLTVELRINPNAMFQTGFMQDCASASQVFLTVIIRDQA